MKRVAILNGDPWVLSRSIPDVRGWETRDGSGQVIGRVDTVFADVTSNEIESVVLDCGRQLTLGEFRIRDGLLQIDESVDPQVSPFSPL